MRRCYRHPDRETGLSCSECGRPICTECMTVAPVGLRCPEHSGAPRGAQRVTRTMRRASYSGESALVTVALLAGSAGALLQAPLAPTVGASGAIFGLFGALLVLEYFATGRIVGGQAFGLIVINLIFSFTFSNISWGGHIGGLVGGILGTLVLARFGRGHAAYGRFGLLGIAGMLLVGAGSIAVAYWKVRGYA